MLGKLLFDTTDAGTIEDTHSVGAYVRAGKGGAIVTYHADNQANSATANFTDTDVNTGTDQITLTAHGFQNGDRVQFSSGDTLPAPLAAATDYWVIYVNANTIKVATSQHNAELGIAIDITDAGTAAGAFTITAQPYQIRALDTYVVNPVEVFATDLDIRDLNAATDSVASWLNDGAGNPISSTGGALDVNIASGTFNVNDAALANTAITANVNTLDVADTAEDVVASPLANRKYLWIYNNDNREMFVGPTGVTSANGFPIPPGTYLSMRAGAAIDIEWVSSKLNHNMRYMELS